MKILQAHGCAYGKLQMLTRNKVDRMKNRCLRSITSWPEQSKPAIVTNLSTGDRKFDEVLVNSVQCKIQPNLILKSDLKILY